MYLVIFFISILSFSSAQAKDKACKQQLSQVINLRPQLSEKDIALVPLNQNHTEKLKELFAFEDVERLFLGKKPGDVAAIEYIKRAKNSSGNLRENYDGLWVIEYKGDFAGYLMLTLIGVENLPSEQARNFKKKKPEDLFLSIGYALHPDFRGKGIAANTVNLILNFAKTDLKANYIFASTNFLNESSKNVLFRNGFSVLPTWMTQRTKFYIKLN